jgi:hypothetical protein
MFGLQEGWVEGDSILKQYTSVLKDICEKFEFEPVGFVVTTEAITQFLKKDEGTPPTTILIRVNDAELQIAVVNLGKIIGYEIVARSEDIGADVEEGLARFKVDEYLPSKMVIYNGSQDLEKLKQDLLSYSWLEKLPFLHFPKVQILDRQVSIKAVALAGGEEAAKAMGFEILTEGVETSKQSEETKQKDSTTAKEEEFSKEEIKTKQTADHSKSEKDLTNEQTNISETAEENIKANVLVADASEIGFSSSKKEESKKEKTEEEESPALMKKKIEEISSESLYQERPKHKLPQPKGLSNNTLLKMFSGLLYQIKQFLQNFHNQISTPSLSRKRNNPFILISLFIIGILVALICAYWFLTKAVVVLYVEPKNLEKDIVITIDPQSSQLDEQTFSIPGKIVESEVEGTKAKQATGTKIVGEKARGEITIYNKTSSEKTFASGTAMSISGGLRFVLDGAVTVASASAQESDESLTTVFGKASAQVSAESIGAEYNINAGEELSIASFSQSSYSAKSSSVFEGGSSREISAVSESDVDELRKQLTDSLKEQAAAELERREGEGKQVLSEGALLDVLSETLSNDVGEEANTVSLTLSVKVKSLAYDESDFLKIVEKAIQDSIPEQFELSQEKSSAEIQEIDFEEDRAQLKFIYKAILLPKINEDEIRKNLVGRYPIVAEEYFSSLPNFSKATIEITPQFLPSRLKTFPRITNNIKIEVLVEPQ